MIGDTYTYTLASLINGNNVQVDGIGVGTDPFSLGSYTVSGGASGFVTIDPSSFVSSLGTAGSLSLNRIGNDLVLTVVAIPEPVTVFGFAAVGLGLGGLIRRKRRPQGI